MSARLLYDREEGAGVLYCSTSGVPLGRVLYGEEGPVRGFLAALDSVRLDPRLLILDALWLDWLRSDGRPVVTCGCGRQYNVIEFRALGDAFHWNDLSPRLESRRCACGSHCSIHVDSCGLWIPDEEETEVAK